MFDIQCHSKWGLACEGTQKAGGGQFKRWTGRLGGVVANIEDVVGEGGRCGKEMGGRKY